MSDIRIRKKNNLVVTNNPFNIRHSSSNGWLGQIGSYCGFTRFDSIDYGIRAGIKLLINYYRFYGLNTPKSLISRFAPVIENNTSAYIEYVCSVLNFSNSDWPITTTNEFYLLCKAILWYESHYVLDRAFFDFICSKFNLRWLC